MPIGRRAPFEPTPEQRLAVEIMAAFNVPQDQIRRALIHSGSGKPITVKTLRARFRQELNNGAAKVKLELCATLIGRAKRDPSGAVAIFMGKTVLGLRENGPDNETAKQIEISGGLPPDDEKK